MCSHVLLFQLFNNSTFVILAGIVFRNHDIYSMYQPDAIKYFDVGGTGYIATANEGATVEYPTWTEEKRGKSLVDGNKI